MDVLEFRFTPEQNATLSVEATSIVDALRPLEHTTELTLFQDILHAASLASTTALYETLGRDHPLFNQPIWPDIVVMQNCPTHVPPTTDTGTHAFKPDLFMSLAMTGPIQRNIDDFSVVSTAPSWHQDLPRTVNSAVVSLYCVNPGKDRVPTSFLSAKALLANLSQSEREYSEGFHTSVESQTGRSLLHLPRNYYVNSGKSPALERAVAHTPVTDIAYEPNTMALFYDLSVLHRTGVDILPGNILSRSTAGRNILRNIFLHDATAPNLDYRANPESALGNLRDIMQQYQSSNSR